jgi:hypothetical protein
MHRDTRLLAVYITLSMPTVCERCGRATFGSTNFVHGEPFIITVSTSSCPHLLLKAYHEQLSVAENSNAVFEPAAKMATCDRLLLFVLTVPRSCLGSALNRSCTLSERSIPYDDVFVVCSMSSKTIVYKGQLTPEQVYLYFAAKIVLLVVQCAFTGSIILSGVLVGFTERC